MYTSRVLEFIDEKNYNEDAISIIEETWKVIERSAKEERCERTSSAATGSSSDEKRRIVILTNKSSVRNCNF